MYFPTTSRAPFLKRQYCGNRSGSVSDELKRQTLETAWTLETLVLLQRRNPPPMRCHDCILRHGVVATKERCSGNLWAATGNSSNANEEEGSGGGGGGQVIIGPTPPLSLSGSRLTVLLVTCHRSCGISRLASTVYSEIQITSKKDTCSQHLRPTDFAPVDTVTQLVTHHSPHNICG